MLKKNNSYYYVEAQFIIKSSTNKLPSANKLQLNKFKQIFSSGFNKYLKAKK